jgi:hypothetical protein
MTRRLMFLGVATLLTLTAGGVWAAWPRLQAPTNPNAMDCCDDPPCPACVGQTAANKGSVTKAVDCCDDLACPPGCSPACPPDCLDFTAKGTNTAGTSQTKARTSCPPCPFCP